MSNTVISFENLSKAYRLGQIGTGTLSNDLKVWWAKKLGLPNPLLKIGESDHGNRDGEILWALKDVNLSIEQGEVLGIIGRNGAGKSTLLKILSRVTAPTSGRVRVKGRIASLLEVGTGFHPELTGKENIYLNGAILGMTKEEVSRRFDEIIAFAEIEKFIDTPVKRYSSGMYVRLAFAVAAHLEPEILVVDEVLAVGDAEFQKKCLGKMGDAAKEGRTVLFVSHNMSAVKSLCKSGMLLQNGSIKYLGDVISAINEYQASAFAFDFDTDLSDKNIGDQWTRYLRIRFINKDGTTVNSISVDDEFGIEFQYEILQFGFRPRPNLLITTSDGFRVFQSLYTDNETLSLGKHISIAWVPKNLLNDQKYVLVATITTHNPVYIHCTVEIGFEVQDNFNSNTRGDYRNKMHGVVRPKLKWEIIN